MELKQYPISRWKILLTNLIFHMMTISIGHAVNGFNPLEVDQKILSQLELDNYSDNPDTELDLYLEVTLNGKNVGLVHFIYDDNQLWASTDVLQQMGFILPSHIVTPISLNRIPNLKVDYNPRQQTVSMIASIDMLNLDMTVHSTHQHKRLTTNTSPGILLNYTLYGTHDPNNDSNLSAYTELRAFNNSGVLSSTALTTAKNDTWDRSDWSAHTVRLDTSWRKSFPDSLITMQAGDIFTSALSWTRPTRLGGLQIGSNFNLQPYMVTTPLPSFFGTATLPSAVELYINGLKQFSTDVPAGPFEFDTVPSFSGAGRAQLVVTDALGQSQTLDFSLYNTHQLLQSGLSDWSFEIGAVREDYGIESFNYADDIAASGTWRYGVNDRFTAETHAEATSGLQNAGIGGTWLLGRTGGVLFASLAGSEGQGKSGTQYSASYSWNNRRFHVGLNAIGTHGSYRDIGTQYGSAPAHRSEQFLTGYSTRSIGSFGLSYNQVTYDQQDAIQLASAYWSKNFGRRLMLNVNLTHDFNNSDNSSAVIGASMALGQNRSASSSLQQQGNGTFFVADISQAEPNSGGVGWRAQTRNSADRNDMLAELSYLGRYGQVKAGIATNEDDLSFYGGSTGSLVMMGGGLFPSRRLNSSFAVVSTNGIANVPILLQNSPIGSTNSKGLLLVSPLNAYQENKIGINPMDLPANMRIDKVSIDATPAEQSGMVVALDITPVNAASVILQDDKNQVIPVGSTVEMLSKQDVDVPAAMVGFDGEVYLDMLDAQNTLQVTTPDSQVCHVSFEYHSDHNDIPLIGPFVCDEVQK